MRIAITGGTGFIGRHLAERLVLEGHEVVLLWRGTNARTEVGRAEKATFVASDLSDQAVLLRAFSGCDAIAHCAGINREIGEQTYPRVHVQATTLLKQPGKLALRRLLS